MIVDIHSHMSHINFEYAIKQYQGMEAKVIVNGLDPKSNSFAIMLSEKYPFVFAANGIHPTEIEHMSEEEIDKELDNISLRQNQLIAIGEIGLDYKVIPESKRAFQKKIFIKQLKLAKRLGKPIIVHSRYAEEHTIDVIKNNFRGKVVLHSFTGDISAAKNLSRKFYFGINPILFRNKNMQKIAEKIPLKRIFVETDYPYVCKTPHDIVKVIAEIAKIKGVSEKKVMAHVKRNYRRVFGNNLFKKIVSAIHYPKLKLWGIFSKLHSKEYYQSLYHIKKQ